MVLAQEFVCNPFCVYLLPLENSEARVTVLKTCFLIVLSGLSRNTSGKGVSFFVLLVSRLPSAVLGFYCLILYQQLRVLFILKILSTVPLPAKKTVVKPHF